jgi:hypothetical protein
MTGTRSMANMLNESMRFGSIIGCMYSNSQVSRRRRPRFGKQNSTERSLPRLLDGQMSTW